MTLSQLPEYVVIIIEIAVVMFSAVLHELAHGYVAYRLGDPTAKRAGRLTLNPLKHLDPFGSVILPFCMAMLHGPIFGFAKPVPFNPRLLHHPRRDSLLVAFAGPLSNFFQAVVGSILFHIILAMNPLALMQVGWLLEILYLYVMVNLVLCFFNLLPLPPLDGSHIFAFFLHGRALYNYYRVQQYALPILLLLLYVFPYLFHVDPLGWYFNATANSLTHAFLFGGLR